MKHDNEQRNITQKEQKKKKHSKKRKKNEEKFMKFKLQKKGIKIPK